MRVGLETKTQPTKNVPLVITCGSPQLVKNQVLHKRDEFLCRKVPLFGKISKISLNPRVLNNAPLKRFKNNKSFVV